MHILSASQFNKTFIDKLFEFSCQVVKFPSFFKKSLKGKILLNVFFEASTRTSLSFETAMKQLGGGVINFNQNVSSMIKGESYEDTIRTLEIYGDIMILRDPNIENLQIASSNIKIPLINAGNGSGEHPTQALLDLYTIYKRFNNIENKNILFMGDIKNSRTIHSLIQLLHLYPSNNIHLWCYNNCEPDEEIVNRINKIHNKPCIIINDENYDLSNIDVVYCTRYQKERVQNNEITNNLIVDKNFMKRLKPDAIVMHPLPRNNEISPEIDNDTRCVYFEQMKNGVEVRKALLLKCFNIW
jgi:aspartate carbamoyltransferase